MCGIVGYVGRDDACPFLIDGLRRLEYRGYDSSGVAIHGGTTFAVTRSVGRIDSLVGRLGSDPASGNFFLAENSRAIDASLDALAERGYFLEVLNSVGLDALGISSPDTDALTAS